MSPRRDGPSFEARPVIAGLPRTKVHTPGFQLSSGLFLFGTGLFMFCTRPPEGEWTAWMLAGWRAGAWTAAVAGGVLLLSAARGLGRWRARVRAAAAGSPDAWLLDHEWTPGACRDRAVAGAAEALFWIVMSGGLAAAALAYARELGDGARLVNAAALALAGLCAACARLSWGTLRRGLLFGESTLRWDGGGPLRAGSVWAGSIAVAEAVSAPYAHLQFVKERRIQGVEDVSYTRHEHDRVEATARLEREPGGRKVLRLSASIPAKAPSTELSRDPARYWELRVSDDASGWTTSFLVPVYR